MTFLTLRTKLGSRIGYPVFAGAYILLSLLSRFHIFLLLMTFLTLRTKLGSRIGYPIFAGAYTGF